MLAAELLTPLTKMSIHRSGIQGTKGAWRVEVSRCMDYIPAKGLALTAPHSKHIIQTHTPWVDQPLRRQSPKHQHSVSEASSAFSDD